MADVTPAEIRFEVDAARARNDLIELDPEHSEHYSCVLTPDWIPHFRQRGRESLDSLSDLEHAYEHLKAQAKRAKDRWEAAKAEAGNLSRAMLSEPPQGRFEFKGRLTVIRGTGHCILLDESGEPITETWRPLTDKERAELTKRDEEAAIVARERAQMSIDDYIDHDTPDPVDADQSEETTTPEPAEESTPFAASRRKLN